VSSTLLFQRFREEAEKEILAQSEALCSGRATDYPNYVQRVAHIKTWRFAVELARRLDREILGLPEEKE
jgi:hypothetical protein